MSAKATHHLYTAQMRPELWDCLADPNHPLNAAWPYFLDQDLTQKYLSERICDFYGLRKFQFVIVERDDTTGKEELVACGRSIPFYWEELDRVAQDGGLRAHPNIVDSLPDGGWDTAIARGIRQYMSTHPEEALSWPWLSPPIFTQDQKWERDQETFAGTTPEPNTLCGISITVRPDRRQMGLAELIIDQMKQTAQQECLGALVIPLRPTLKPLYPFLPLEEYVAWTQEPINASLPQTTCTAFTKHPPYASRDALPFDPWLRKHVRMGAIIAKVAPRSMLVDASLDEWEEWTGIRFDWCLSGIEPCEMSKEPASERRYVQIPLRGGLVPLKVYPEEGRAVYVEPNIWVYHHLDMEQW